MPDTIEIDLRLTCYVREDEGEWVAGCPVLDVYTQADTKEGSKEALREAVTLWLESCLARETLPAAMRELGWGPLERRPETGDYLGVKQPEASDSAASVLGESFPIELQVPYGAASVTADPSAAC
jgi:predicted RNase H-like HicB family nuclease